MLINAILKEGHAMVVERKVTWLEFAEAARELQLQISCHSKKEEEKITKHFLGIHPHKYTTHSIEQLEPC